MNYEIFGLPEGAPFDDVTAAYRRLKAQYGEDRFAEGEKGNEASRKLAKLEQAYSAMAFQNNRRKDAEKFGKDYGSADELIKRGKLEGAQAALDAMTERTGEWHYLQSIIFYKRGWFAESKKQLRLACTMEPKNPKFAAASQKMDDYIANIGTGAGANTRLGPSQNSSGDSGQPPTDRNLSLSNGCLDACCCAQCLSCCLS